MVPIAGRVRSGNGFGVGAGWSKCRNGQNGGKLGKPAYYVLVFRSCPPVFSCPHLACVTTMSRTRWGLVLRPVRR